MLGILDFLFSKTCFIEYHQAHLIQSHSLQAFTFPSTFSLLLHLESQTMIDYPIIRQLISGETGRVGKERTLLLSQSLVFLQDSNQST